MKRTITQILQVLMILVLVLTIPLLIEYISGTRYKNTPEITPLSATAGGQVQAASTSLETVKNSKSSLRLIHTYTIYGITLLFLISIISFINHKTKHKKHG
jgi:hypothetical protein